MRRVMLLVLALVLLVSFVYADGPFGLRPGMSLSEARRICSDLEHQHDDLYITTCVPREHRKFQIYALRFHKDRGLYFIRAVSYAVSTNVYGMQLMSEYNEVVEIMTNLYGKPSESINSLLPGSIWNDPQDFMPALFREERHIITMWDSLPGDLSKIWVIAEAIRRDSGIIIIEYNYWNTTQLSEEGKEKAPF